MKIVIDIPEDIYDRCREYKLHCGEAEVLEGAVANGAPLLDERLSNSEWIDFLCKQFDISRTSAKEMLHVMMSVKKEDNFKKQFSRRK